MVLVKVLMEIHPLPMRGSMVMTMVMISPSRRDVSPAEQLRRSPRLVSPGSASRRRRFIPKASVLFFQDKRLHIAKDGHRRPARVPTRHGGTPRGVGRAPPPSWTGCEPPGLHLVQRFFIISEKLFREVSGHSENFCFCT